MIDFREKTAKKIEGMGQRRIVPIASAARTLGDLRGPCFAGLQPAMTKRIWHGRAQESIPWCCDAPGAGLQLQAAKRIVTAARKVVFDKNSATLLLRGVAEATEELRWVAA